MASFERPVRASTATRAATAALLSASLVLGAPAAPAFAETTRLGADLGGGGAPDAVTETAAAVGIRATMLAEAARARRWRYAWTAINGGLTVGSFALMPLSDRRGWPELVVGGIGSGLSTALTVAWPLDVERAPAAAASSADAAGLEALRLSYAQDERDRLRWPWHLLNVGVGAAYFCILGLGWGHWRSGALAGLSAFAIGELQTVTQPAALSDAAPASPSLAARVAVRPSFDGGRGGVSGVAIAGRW